MSETLILGYGLELVCLCAPVPARTCVSGCSESRPLAEVLLLPAGSWVSDGVCQPTACVSVTLECASVSGCVSDFGCQGGRECVRVKERLLLLPTSVPPPDCFSWPLGFPCLHPRSSEILYWLRPQPPCRDFKVPVGSIHLPGPPGISIDLQGKWRARLGYYAPARLPWAVIECTQRIFETWPP